MSKSSDLIGNSWQQVKKDIHFLTSKKPLSNLAPGQLVAVLFLGLSVVGVSASLALVGMNSDLRQQAQVIYADCVPPATKISGGQDAGGCLCPNTDPDVIVNPGQSCPPFVPPAGFRCYDPALNCSEKVLNGQTFSDWTVQQCESSEWPGYIDQIECQRNLIVTPIPSVPPAGFRCYDPALNCSEKVLNGQTFSDWTVQQCESSEWPGYIDQNECLSRRPVTSTPTRAPTSTPIRYPTATFNPALTCSPGTRTCLNGDIQMCIQGRGVYTVIQECGARGCNPQTNTCNTVSPSPIPTPRACQGVCRSSPSCGRLGLATSEGQCFNAALVCCGAAVDNNVCVPGTCDQGFMCGNNGRHIIEAECVPGMTYPSCGSLIEGQCAFDANTRYATGQVCRAGILVASPLCGACGQTLNNHCQRNSQGETGLMCQNGSLVSDSACGHPCGNTLSGWCERDAAGEFTGMVCRGDRLVDEGGCDYRLCGSTPENACELVDGRRTGMMCSGEILMSSPNCAPAVVSAIPAVFSSPTPVPISPMPPVVTVAPQGQSAVVNVISSVWRFFQSLFR